MAWRPVEFPKPVVLLCQKLVVDELNYWSPSWRSSQDDSAGGCHLNNVLNIYRIIIVLTLGFESAIVIESASI